MDLSFNSIVTFISDYFFGGSTTLAGLAMLVMAWAVAAVICLNMRASPAYSVVPMIPIAIFFAAYGILNETIMIVLVLVSALIVASEFKRVVD